MSDKQRPSDDFKKAFPHENLISVGEQALMDGKGRSLKDISESNPVLAKHLTETVGKFINLYWSNISTHDLIQVYRNIKSLLQKEERRKMLKYLTPRAILESRRLYDYGLKIKMNEPKPYKPGEEWDYEATFETMLSSCIFDTRHVDYSIIKTQRKSRAKRAFVIIADKSSSLMDKIHIVAVGTGMIAYAGQWDFISVIVFDSEIEFLKRFHEGKELGRVIEQIIDMDSGGATDLHKPLEAAKKEFSHVPLFINRKAIMISDCIPTMGKNPIEVAAELESLIIFYLPQEGGRQTEGIVQEFRRLPNVRIFPIKHFEDFINGIYEVFTQ